MSEERSAQEIVIIKRGGGHEEEHGSHGLWKIAYADFMTALMAFFLVMWLVNAANKKTLAQVATYFNPMEMSDQQTQNKGIHPLAGEQQPSESEKKEQAEQKQEGAVSSENSKDVEVDEQGMFRDPYGVLSKLSSKATTFRRGEDNVQQGGSKNTISDVYNGGEGYRDPFDPNFRQDESAVDPIPSDPIVADGVESQNQDSARSALTVPPEASPTNPTTAQAAVAQAAPAGSNGLATSPPSEPSTPATPSPESAAASQGGGGVLADKTDKVDKAVDPATVKADASALAHAQALRTAISDLVKSARTKVPDIEVTANGEGILVSLMDDAQFGMFAIGSAKPKPELVAVLEKIAGLIKAETGQIIVRGHTDGRPYKSLTYDNWRLSTARAHMAYYMLVHGGIGEGRFERVEGYADRKLKVPGDAGAASNRRIEILLKAQS